MEKSNEQIRAEKLVRLAALKRSDDFAWFIEKCVRPKYNAAESTLHSKKVSKDERENACHVSSALESILNWLDDELKQAESEQQK